MNCKEIEKNIPKFINRECSSKEEEILIEHVKKCHDCKEELTIQFLLKEGLNRLEAGESFDLNEELERRLKEHAKEKKKRRSWLDPDIAKVLWDLLTWGIVVVVIVVLLFWKIR